MITSATNYTKKQTKKTKQIKTNKKSRSDKTQAQMVKSKLYRPNHTKKHTHTHSQKQKNIYIKGREQPNQ